MTVHIGGRGPYHIARLNTGVADPLAADVLALDFKNADYWVGGTKYTSVSDLPGYVYSDNVDNLPTINSNGYLSLVSENPSLQANVNPITSEQDFIWWSPFSVIALTTYQIAAWTSGSAYLGLSSIHDYLVNLTGAEITGAAAGVGRSVVLGRRRGGKTTLAYKDTTGVVTLMPEGGVTALASLTSTMFIGCRDLASGGGIQTDGYVEGLFMRTGTFTDADITAILTTA